MSGVSYHVKKILILSIVLTMVVMCSLVFRGDEKEWLRSSCGPFAVAMNGFLLYSMISSAEDDRKTIRRIALLAEHAQRRAGFANFHGTLVNIDMARAITQALSDPQTAALVIKITDVARDQTCSRMTEDGERMKDLENQINACPQ